MPNSVTLSTLESHLPPPESVASFFESYCNHASHFYRPVKREELFNVILPRIYTIPESPSMLSETSPRFDGESEEDSTVVHTRPHELATIFFILALGALLDLNLPPYNQEAEHFYDLGRAALSLQAVYESPGIQAVQAMGLMATYHTLAGRKYSRDSAVRQDFFFVNIHIDHLLVVHYELCSKIGTKCELHSLEDPPGHDLPSDTMNRLAFVSSHVFKPETRR